MPTKKISFRCYHPDCANDPPTELILDVPRRPAARAKPKDIVAYCTRNHMNLLTVEGVSEAGPILGGDNSGPRGGTPPLQGRQG